MAATKTSNSVPITLEAVASAMTLVREKTPLVHNITNYVVMNVTANTLLAGGASPAMVHSTEEVAEFVALCSSLVINIGTVSPDWAAAMRLAARTANEKSIPWVLDPVAAPISRFRSAVAADLVALKPTVIRGNAGEIMALAGAAGAMRGVDSTSNADDAVTAAISLAKTTGSVIAVTGVVDRVTDGNQVIEIETGDQMMALITGSGCSSSALVGAYIGAHPGNPLLAATAALSVYGSAGKRAAETASGPGSLQVGLLDALYTMTHEHLTQHVTLQSQGFY